MKEKEGAKEQDWREGSVGKVLAPHQEDPSSTSEPMEKRCMLWCVLVVPALGRWRQADPWGSLHSQPSSASEFEI